MVNTDKQFLDAIHSRIINNTITVLPEEICSPLDEMQHNSGLVEDISNIWYRDFNVFYDKKYYCPVNIL